MSDLIEREYLLNIARKEEAYGYVSEHEIINAPNAETTGALDDAIQEYIKDGYILAEPNEYVKDGTLTVQMPTMKEAKSIEKVVVYADTYKQEYSLPKVGKRKIEEMVNIWGKGYRLTCLECGDVLTVTENALPYERHCRCCGAKMERSE